MASPGQCSGGAQPSSPLRGNDLQNTKQVTGTALESLPLISSGAREAVHEWKAAANLQYVTRGPVHHPEGRQPAITDAGGNGEGGTRGPPEGGGSGLLFAKGQRAESQEVATTPRNFIAKQATAFWKSDLGPAVAKLGETTKAAGKYIAEIVYPRLGANEDMLDSIMAAKGEMEKSRFVLEQSGLTSKQGILESEEVCDHSRRSIAQVLTD
jgi:hypothetical protein